jgi:quinol monooxygenase YgiN
MENSGLRVVVNIKSKPDRVDDLQKALDALAQSTREEDGCLSYEFLQNKSEPTDIVLLEHWRDKAALGAHSKTGHFQKGMEDINEMTSEQIQIAFYKKFA